MLGIETEPELEVSVEELRLMIDEGRNIGVLEPKEEIMLEQILRFDDARIEINCELDNEPFSSILRQKAKSLIPNSKIISQNNV